MNIGIIGAGGWGTAITIPLIENGHNIYLWAFEHYVATEINESKTNNTYLPGVKIPEEVVAVNDFDSIKHCDLFVIAVPTEFLRKTIEPIKQIFSGKPVVSLVKGIEQHSLMRVSEILADCADIQSSQFVIITGPSHAEEVARKMPTTVTAASECKDTVKIIQQLFSTQYFRVYTSDDVIGSEIGGSLKNVIAIAAGIIDGLGLGDNTKAALITRGLAEMFRLSTAIGAKPQTLSGLAGLGDLIVTCNSKHSRNRYVGEQIGLGKSLSTIKQEMKKVAEGVYTTESAYFLSKKHDVEMPIVEQMYKIIFENVHPLEAIRELMNRESKSEWWQ